MKQASHVSGWVLAWLLLAALMLLITVLLGGATRLADAGLSIVEWKPVTGVWLPISDSDWAAEFAKYKTIAEYHTVNSWMSLEDFKVIYFWEWGHRMAARLVGLTILLPLGYLLIARRGSVLLRWQFGVMLALVLLQGVVGWWMVKSGLVPYVEGVALKDDVSPVRLGLHLTMASVLFAFIIYVAFDQMELVRNARTRLLSQTPQGLGGAQELGGAQTPPQGLGGAQEAKEAQELGGAQEAQEARVLSESKLIDEADERLATASMTEIIRTKFFMPWVFVLLILVQILLGAFVAGSNAGYVYNNWPLMGDGWLPPQLFGLSPVIDNLVYNHGLVQLNHRLMAYIICVLAVVHVIVTRRGWLLLAVVAQVMLGIVVLVSAVPLDLALAHQLTAFVLLGIATHELWFYRRHSALIAGRAVDIQ